LAVPIVDKQPSDVASPSSSSSSAPPSSLSSDPDRKLSTVLSSLHAIRATRRSLMTSAYSQMSKEHQAHFACHRIHQLESASSESVASTLVRDTWTGGGQLVPETWHEIRRCHGGTKAQLRHRISSAHHISVWDLDGMIDDRGRASTYLNHSMASFVPFAYLEPESPELLSVMRDIVATLDHLQASGFESYLPPAPASYIHPVRSIPYAELDNCRNCWNDLYSSSYEHSMDTCMNRRFMKEAERQFYSIDDFDQKHNKMFTFHRSFYILKAQGAHEAYTPHTQVAFKCPCGSSNAANTPFCVKCGTAAPPSLQQVMLNEAAEDDVDLTLTAPVVPSSSSHLSPLPAPFPLPTTTTIELPQSHYHDPPTNDQSYSSTALPMCDDVAMSCLLPFLPLVDRLHYLRLSKSNYRLRRQSRSYKGLPPVKMKFELQLKFSSPIFAIGPHLRQHLKFAVHGSRCGVTHWQWPISPTSREFQFLMSLRVHAFHLMESRMFNRKLHPIWPAILSMPSWTSGIELVGGSSLPACHLPSLRELKINRLDEFGSALPAGELPFRLEHLHLFDADDASINSERYMTAWALLPRCAATLTTLTLRGFSFAREGMPLYPDEMPLLTKIILRVGNSNDVAKETQRGQLVVNAVMKIFDGSNVTIELHVFVPGDPQSPAAIILFRFGVQISSNGQ